MKNEDNSLLDDFLNRNEYELALENVCIGLIALKEDLQSKLTESNSEVIKDVINVINRINYSVRIKYEISSKINKKYQITKRS